MWLGDTQVAGKTLFLGMLVRMFLEEIVIWINRMIEEGPPLPNVGGPHPIG
jgi:hypothetical protein